MNSDEGLKFRKIYQRKLYFLTIFIIFTIISVALFCSMGDTTNPSDECKKITNDLQRYLNYNSNKNFIKKYKFLKYIIDYYNFLN